MKPLGLKKIKLPLSSFWAMSDEHRSSLLLLGLFLNEANWLMKLLVKTGKALPPEPVPRAHTPEEEANYSLVMLTMTTLVGKIWEGWGLISRGKKLRPTIDALVLPNDLRTLEAKLARELSTDLFVRIRNNVSFHYSEKLIDLSRLKPLVTERDTHIYVTGEGYIGDTLCPLSTLAGLEPVLHSKPTVDVQIALREVIAEILPVVGSYCDFVSRLLILLIVDDFGRVAFENVTVPDAPEVETEPMIHFFVHPPKDLEKIRNSLA